jgi:hypothetical protein
MTDTSQPKPARGHRLTALDVLAELAIGAKSERHRLTAALELARQTRPQPRARPERKPRPAVTPNAWARARDA